jgi:hypothetical protein
MLKLIENLKRISFSQMLCLGGLATAFVPAALAGEKIPGASEIHAQVQKLKSAYASSLLSGQKVRILNRTALQPQSVDIEIHCGDVITQSSRIMNDLVCPDTTGFAVGVNGNGINIDGNGHSITAPNAQTGWYLQGSDLTFTGAIVHGITNGAGVTVHDVNGIDLGFNDVSFNQTGILIYAEQNTIDTLSLHDNLAVGNALFGIRTTQESPGIIMTPFIQHNNLSYSGSFGLYLQASGASLSLADQNDYLNCINGIYLKDGTFVLNNLSFSNSRIQKRAVFVDSALSFTANALDVGTSQVATPSQERVGLHLYKVASFAITQLSTSANDVGVKIATEGGVKSTGSVTDSVFQGNTTAGIMTTSYDGTAFGTMSLNSNTFQLPAGVPAVLSTP